jgi:glycosyltransferase involved in cell wall biosynthesis
MSERGQPADTGQNEIELSVVMPCLNEADTLETCIRKAQQGLAAADVVGEIVVADNGSSDGCPEIAERLGARVEHVQEKGYGSALMGGIAAARGRFVLMGDADDSYDFLEIPKFVEGLRAGHDLVQGCRLPAGGGRVLPGAMPFLHRWIGNPMLTALARTMFGIPIHDTYCGMRGFTKALYDGLDQRCTGMEFATEMIIKSSLTGADIAEVPITLHPDGRKTHGPHLRTFRDGWRTLRFFLMYSPRWLFLIPGLLLIALGTLGSGLAMQGAVVFGANLDIHTLLVSCLAIMMGYQSILFSLLSKTFAISVGLMPPDPRLDRFYGYATLERGLLLGAAALVCGLGLIVHTMSFWQQSGFGALDYPQTMRAVIPGVTLAAIGFQTILSGFFVSTLGMSRR